MLEILAEIGRACLRAEPNAGHFAIAEWQRQRPGTWLLTQNIDGFHRRAGSPPERLIEIHGELAPLSCMACGEIDRRPLASLLDEPLPPRCEVCTGVLRPAVVLFEEMLPSAPRALAGTIAHWFRCRAGGRHHRQLRLYPRTHMACPAERGPVVEVNLQPTDISPLANLSLREGPQTFCRTYYVTFHPIEFDHRSDSGHSRGHFEITDTVVPMRQRFAPLVPLALIALLTACAGQPVQTEQQIESPRLSQNHPRWLRLRGPRQSEEESLAELTDEHEYQLPELADSILERGFTRSVRLIASVAIR